ncbi:hypothetical protein HDV00_008669 [Rhizophlyctis rosea]|nr:hypothetical protein HDV00_008669 [Rhizophlyctis rosea]
MSYQKLRPLDDDPTDGQQAEQRRHASPTFRPYLAPLQKHQRSTSPFRSSVISDTPDPWSAPTSYLAMRDMDAVIARPSEESDRPMKEIKLEKEEPEHEGTYHARLASLTESTVGEPPEAAEQFIKIEATEAEVKIGRDVQQQQQQGEAFKSKEKGREFGAGISHVHARFAGHGTAGAPRRYTVGFIEGFLHAVWLMMTNVVIPVALADTLFRYTTLPPAAILGIATAAIFIKYFLSAVWSLIRRRRLALMDSVGLLMLAFLTPHILLILLYPHLTTLPFAILIAILHPLALTLLLLLSLLPILHFVSFPHHVARDFLTARNAVVKRDWDEVVAVHPGVRRAWRMVAWVWVVGTVIEAAGRTILILFTPFYPLGARILAVVLYTTILIFSVRTVKRTWHAAANSVGVVERT